MTKQFLYIVDPLPRLNAQTDTTLVMMEEAGRRGVRNFACEISDIVLDGGRLYFKTAPVLVARGYETPPIYLEQKQLRTASDFQAVFMRKDPPVDDNFLTALFCLRCHGAATTIINDPDGILVANEKLFGLSIAEEYFPPTVVTSDKSVVHDFAEQHETVVVKPLFNAGGSGVLVLKKDDRNFNSALEIVTNNFSAPAMVQSYIKSVREGDKRIIVVGGRALGAVMRVPRADDHRANFHAGGSAQATSLSDRDREIVNVLSPHLVRLGLHVVGIDVIGGYLTEINVTSPTCVIEIEKLSQQPGEQPLRSQILDYVEELIA